MPWWVLECPQCKQEFTHSEVSKSHASIPDPFIRDDVKPEFPVSGLTLSCPNCNQPSNYLRHQLFYRAT
jgi:hypothetical protein